METNDAREQLAAIDRLQVSAISEGQRLPVWSFAALAIGATAALGIVLASDASAASIVAAILVWNAIVLSWTWLTSRGRRVEPKPEPSLWSNPRKGVALTIAVNVALYALVYLFGARIFYIVGGLYVAYLVYIALGDFRQATRRS